MCLCFYDLRFVGVLLMVDFKVIITLCAYLYFSIFVFFNICIVFLTIDLNLFKIFDMLLFFNLLYVIMFSFRVLVFLLVINLFKCC